MDLLQQEVHLQKRKCFKELSDVLIAGLELLNINVVVDDNHHVLEQPYLLLIYVVVRVLLDIRYSEDRLGVLRV